MTDNSYMQWASMSDKRLAERIGTFIKHHRLIQNKTQKELAAESGISRSTLSLLERGETVTLSTLIQILRVLEQLQIMNAFAIDETPGPLALARLQKEKRLRARTKTPENTNVKNNTSKETDW